MNFPSVPLRSFTRSILATIGIGLTLVALPQVTWAQYSFSYNFTSSSGGNNQRIDDAVTTTGLGPWSFTSVADNNTTANGAQIRVRTPDGLPAVPGPSPDIYGITIRSRAASAGNAGNGTLTYYGNTSGTSSVPFVMDLSAVGSTFTMTMGYAPNPASSGIRDQPPNVGDVGSQLMKMGMVSVTNKSNPATLGINDSLFIDYRETTSVAGSSGSTTGFYEVRTLNSGTSVATGVTQLGGVTLQAGNATSATDTNFEYYFYVYSTTYTNAGYDTGGEALFNVVMSVQTYTINNPTGATAAFGAPTTYTANNVSTDLNATDLTTMYAAMGYRFPNTAMVSVTGSTYDYFSTNITNIPEPTAVGLLGLSAMALLPRRRRKR